MVLTLLRAACQGIPRSFIHEAPQVKHLRLALQQRLLSDKNSLLVPDAPNHEEQKHNRSFTASHLVQAETSQKHDELLSVLREAHGLLFAANAKFVEALKILDEIQARENPQSLQSRVITHEAEKK